MTEVIYEEKRHHIRIEGHAGAAPKGEDLVCAGVSALGFALLLAVEDEVYRAEIETDADSATIDVRCFPRGVWVAMDCDLIMQTIAGGLEMIAKQHPEHVTFKRRS